MEVLDLKRTIPKPKKKRECGMMAVAGGQSIGKTYLSMHVIADYIKDKIEKGVRGRKMLIFDTNGEYVESQFEANGIKNFKVRTIAVKDIEAWGLSNVVECRRIDAKMLTIKEKKNIVEYIVRVYRAGGLALEDLNNYILSVTHMENIVSGLINLRHRAVDVLVSYQSLRAIEPRIFANSRWFRLHFQADDTDTVEKKLPDPISYKLAQLMINKHYNDGDIRFNVYISNMGTRLEGMFTREDFVEACRTFLYSKKRLLKETMGSHDVGEEEAVTIKTEEYYNHYVAKKNK